MAIANSTPPTGKEASNAGNAANTKLALARLLTQKLKPSFKADLVKMEN
jgi:hypothetical protein